MTDLPLGSHSDLDGLIQRLDPRIKILGTSAFVLFVVLTPPMHIWRFTSYLGIVAGLIALARLPLLLAVRRSLVIIPFVLLVGIFLLLPGILQLQPGMGTSGPNLWTLWNVTIKAWLSVLSVIVLTATTSASELLQGLAGLKVPKLIVMLLSFLLRYIPLLASHVAKLRWAIEARSPGRQGLGLRKRRLGPLGSAIGTLFIRSYEQGERIYGAMLARGFTGEIRTVRRTQVCQLDVAFIALLLSILILIQVFI